MRRLLTSALTAGMLPVSGCVTAPYYASSPGVDYYSQMYEQLGHDEYMRRFGPRIAELQARLASIDSSPTYSGAPAGVTGGTRSSATPSPSYASRARSYSPSSSTAIRSGNMLYGSDGTSTTRSGNMYYHSDGTSTMRSGNTFYNSGGGSTTRIGNNYLHSDGSSTTRVGNTFINSDGSSTTVLGR